MDSEAARAEAEKDRAIDAEDEVVRLRGDSPRKPPAIRADHRLASEALKPSGPAPRRHARLCPGARGALGVLQEPAAAYWNNTETPPTRGTEESVNTSPEPRRPGKALPGPTLAAGLARAAMCVPSMRVKKGPLPDAPFHETT